MISQPFKQCKFGLIEGLPSPISYGKKANPTARPLGAQTQWRNEQRRSARHELSPLHSVLIAS
jgi:hypothetical protein